MLDKLMEFINTFDFDALMDFLIGGGIEELAVKPVFIGVVALAIILMAIPVTREVSTIVVKYICIFIYLFTCGVALKNSNITEVGPFILLVVLGGSIAANQIWHKFIKGG